jgi:hypothetical protein
LAYPSKNLFDERGIGILVFLWNGGLFLLKALGGAAPKQQCPLRTVERLRRKPVFGFENEARLCILAIWAQGA